MEPKQNISTLVQLQQELWIRLNQVYDRNRDPDFGQITIKEIDNFVFDLFVNVQNLEKTIFRQAFTKPPVNVKGRIDRQYMIKSVLIDYVVRKTYQLNNDNIMIKKSQIGNLLRKIYQNIIPHVFLTINVVKQMYLEMAQDNQTEIYIWKQFNNFFSYRFQLPKIKQTLQQQYIKRSPFTQKPNPQYDKNFKTYSKLKQILDNELKTIYQKHIGPVDKNPDIKKFLPTLKQTLNKMFHKLKQDSLIFQVLYDVIRAENRIDFRFFLKQFYKFYSMDKWTEICGGLAREFNRKQFVILFNNTFGYFINGSLKSQFIEEHFEAIVYIKEKDKQNNKNAVIRYEHYRRWLVDFISVESYYRTDYRTVKDSSPDYDPYEQKKVASKENILQANINPQQESSQASLIKQSKPFQKYKDLQPQQRFKQVLYDYLQQNSIIFDYNKNGIFSMDEIEPLVRSVLGLNQSEIKFMLKQFFYYSGRRQGKQFRFQQLYKIIFVIYFTQILFRRKFKQIQTQKQWKTHKIRSNILTQYIKDSCKFTKQKSSFILQQDIQQILQKVSQNQEVKFVQYVDFMYRNDMFGIPMTESKRMRQASQEEKNLARQLKESIAVEFVKCEVEDRQQVYNTVQNFIINKIKASDQHFQQLMQYLNPLFISDSNLLIKDLISFILQHEAKYYFQKIFNNKNHKKNIIVEGQLNMVLQTAFKKFLVDTKLNQDNAKISKVASFIEIRNRQTSSVMTYEIFYDWIERVFGRNSKN